MASIPELHVSEYSPSLEQRLQFKEKSSGKTSPDEKEEINGSPSDDSDGPLRNQEEVLIRSGRDISEYIVDVRDDGDACLTFRSLVLGTLFAGLAASLAQIYLFKPTSGNISPIFLLIVIYVIGNAWSACLPRRSLVEGGRLDFLSPVFDFVNPGPFGLKEHAVASLVAITASRTNSAVLNFAAQKLFYDTRTGATTAVLATFSTACFGYGLVGVLRPLTVYPSEMVYWTNLPTVTVFQALHFDTAANHKRVKLFWIAMTGIFCYEIFPAYIFPLLNGVSVFCLASQSASPRIRDVFTNIFGGAEGNEGLGLLSLSFDWQYIGSQYMTLPLVQQANAWAGHAICYMVFATIYYTNAWHSQSFPMLSASIFTANGTVYPQRLVFDSHFQLNQTALDHVGHPFFAGSAVWSNLMNNLAVGGLIAHVLLFWGPSIQQSFKLARKNEQPDRHYQAMRKYKEAPWWWYTTLLVLSFVAGLIVVIKGQTSLPVWSYIIALAFGALITPFAIILSARMGTGIYTMPLMKMLAGAIHPGQPIANLYFSMWSHDVIGSALYLSTDLKMGQYLKIPPRVMILTQVWGTILGAIVNYVVMISIVDSRREILLNPLGTNVWSGQMVQGLNSSAVTWSLARQLYGLKGPYYIIPLGFLIGIIPTTVQWLVWKRFPKIGPLKLSEVVLPVVYMFASFLGVGVTSTVLSTIIVGITSQVWLRAYHRSWYKKYNYILGGALDGGAQTMIFILSFAVYGAAGVERPFPKWAGNPAKGNVDYCNGNGASLRSRR